MSETEEFIKKIEDAMITGKDATPMDEWESGFNSGLSWAVRILKKDKSAY